jgi:hypothetical protein
MGIMVVSPVNGCWYTADERRIIERIGMIKRRKSFLMILMAMPMLLIRSMALTSCKDSGTSGTGYKTMTVKNRIANFSFEYRSFYKDVDGPRVEDSSAHRFTVVYVLASKKTAPMPNPEPGGDGTVGMEYVPASIEVGAADAAKYPDLPAKVRIDGLLESVSTWPHYKLLERTTVVVAGAEAELVAFQVDGFFGLPPMIYKALVSFDLDGIQWDIDVEAELEMAEIMRADLDHLLQTFKILE